jgi:hypothetical protein
MAGIGTTPSRSVVPKDPQPPEVDASRSPQLTQGRIVLGLIPAPIRTVAEHACRWERYSA